MRFLAPIDLTRNELQNAVIQNLATAPSSPVTGLVYFDTSLGYLRYWKGASWGRLDDIWATGTAVTSPIVNSGTSIAPNLTVQAASASQDGYLSSSDYTKLSNATSSNTNGAIVQRDGSGNFAANIITANSVTVSNSPSSATDAANKSYVDGLVNGTHWKPPVRVVAMSNITLSGTQTIDSVSLSINDRVLVANQGTASQNGIYVVASGSWTRAVDLAAGSNAANASLYVSEGTTYQDTQWTCITNAASALVGTDALSFTQFGAGSSYNADGSTLQLSGSTFSVKDGGITNTQVSDTAAIARTKLASGSNNHVIINNGSGVMTSEANLAITRGGTGAGTAAAARAALGVPGIYVVSVGNGSNTAFTVTHNLNNADAAVQVWETDGDKELVYADVSHDDANNVTVVFAAAPSTNQYRITVIG